MIDKIENLIYFWFIQKIIILFVWSKYIFNSLFQDELCIKNLWFISSINNTDINLTQNIIFFE